LRWEEAAVEVEAVELAEEEVVELEELESP
jgi:hypothetical protein